MGFLLGKVLMQLAQGEESMRHCVLDRRVDLCVGLTVAVRLKHWIPSKARWASCVHDLALNAAFKEDRLIIWSSGIGNITVRRSTLVRESNQHLVQTLKTNTLQEPLNVGSRKAIEGIESKSCVLDKNRSVNDLGCQSTLFAGNLLARSLKLGKINVDGLELEVITEDSAGLSQFVLVACDKDWRE